MVGEGVVGGLVKLGGVRFWGRVVKIWNGWVVVRVIIIGVGGWMGGR